MIIFKNMSHNNFAVFLKNGILVFLTQAWNY